VTGDVPFTRYDGGGRVLSIPPEGHGTARAAYETLPEVGPAPTASVGEAS